MLGKAMIEGIRAWINGSWTDGQDKSGSQDGLKLALTALLIEAANCDDRFDESERWVIARLLERRFGLSKSAADQLLAAGEIAASEATELFHFTRIINDRLSLADRALDEYEDSLLRRVGGLIYVPDRERGMARQRVLKRFGLDQATGCIGK